MKYFNQKPNAWLDFQIAVMLAVVCGIGITGLLYLVCIVVMG